MPLIPLAVTWLVGWLVYRLLGGQTGQISLLAIGSALLLGAVSIHAVYYVATLIFNTNPTPAVLLILAGVGLIVCGLDAARSWHYVSMGKSSSLPLVNVCGGLIFLGVISLMALLIAVQGFGNDTARIWLGRAIAYDTLPDYFYHFSNYPYHPDYPPLVTHLYQWQSIFTDTLFGLKLPALGFYLATLSGVYTLLRGQVGRPLLWLLVIALLPGFWFHVPFGMADVPLGTYITVGIAWLWLGIAHDQPPGSLRIGTVILSGGVLVKQEGIILLVCVIAALAIIAITQQAQPVRKRARETLGLLLLCGSVLTLSWYGLVWFGDTPPGDFALSAFDLSKLPIILSTVAFTIIDPRAFQGIFVIFILMVLVAHVKNRFSSETFLIWLPLASYLLVMLLPYLFSTYGSVTDHVRFSYGRLLQQVLPLVAVYVAWGLAKRAD